MDNYAVKLSSRAYRNLDDIYAYIARSLQEPEIAEKLLDDIENAIFSLEQLPNRCPLRKTGAYANGSHRQLMVKSYCIVFRVDEMTKLVTVLTVRYAPSQF